MRLIVGALVLSATLLLTAFAVWLLLKGNDSEHEARAGGVFLLVFVVPPGALWSWLLLSRPRGR